MCPLSGWFRNAEDSLGVPLVSDGGEDLQRTQDPNAMICSPDGCPVHVRFHIKVRYVKYPLPLRLPLIPAGALYARFLLKLSFKFPPQAVIPEAQARLRESHVRSMPLKARFQRYSLCVVFFLCSSEQLQGLLEGQGDNLEQALPDELLRLEPSDGGEAPCQPRFSHHLAPLCIRVSGIFFLHVHMT